MYPSRTQKPLERFFAGLAEHTFHGRLGVADTRLVDYIASLLARFADSDAHLVRNISGKRVDEVAEMMVEAQVRVGDARREVYRQIGDFTLFWTGVFPEALTRLQHPDRKDHLLDYSDQGKRSYYMASRIRSQESAEECEVLERLAHEFDLCVHGLGEVRREWERRDADGTGPGGKIWVN